MVYQIDKVRCPLGKGFCLALYVNTFILEILRCMRVLSQWALLAVSFQANLYTIKMYNISFLL